MKRIYLDNNATTPVDPRLLDLYTKLTFTSFGNPSSVHSYGQEAKAYLVTARDKIANIFGVRSSEVVFTSCATEALNMMLKTPGHIVTSDVEHSAVYNALQGSDVTYLPVGIEGAPTPEALEAAIRDTTRLIVLMSANNETGAITDIDAMADIALRKGIPLIVDAVAHYGKAPFTLHPGITCAAYSGHKFYAPKGTGFAIIRKGYKVTPLIKGGHQEHGMRAGTENLAGIVAMAEAASFIDKELDTFIGTVRELRDYFEREVLKIYPKAEINGKGPRIANTSNICFRGIDGEALLMYLDLNGVLASLGSACSSGSIEPSRILLNMGLSRDDALSSIRFSLSRFTTLEEIDQALHVIKGYFRSQAL